MNCRTIMSYAAKLVIAAMAISYQGAGRNEQVSRPVSPEPVKAPAAAATWAPMLPPPERQLHLAKNPLLKSAPITLTAPFDPTRPLERHRRIAPITEAGGKSRILRQSLTAKQELSRSAKPRRTDTLRKAPEDNSTISPSPASSLGGCWTGCSPSSIAEPEPCDYVGADTVNGGCDEGGSLVYIDPGLVVCGSARNDATGFDTDWYADYLFDGDSVTWCVMPHFQVALSIVDISEGCGNLIELASNSGNCDTIYVGTRITHDGLYAFIVRPQPDIDTISCAIDPGYQARLVLSPACQWGGCPPGVSAFEGEICITQGADNYNNGCDPTSPHFSVAADGQYVCGTTWSVLGEGDSDWFLRHVQAGETVTFAAQSEVPIDILILDIETDCSQTQALQAAQLRPCEVGVITATASAETDFACVVVPSNLPAVYLCENADWEYTVVINPPTGCDPFACDPSATIEPEPCQITAAQGFNAGCIGNPPSYATITYNEKVCGGSWYGTAGFAFWRDTDWHSADVKDGDSVVWRVSAQFPFDAWIIDVAPAPDCNLQGIVTVAYQAGQGCDTAYLSAVKQPGQDLKFVIAPRFTNPPMWCELSNWNWEATLLCPNCCACDCLHDPDCDSAATIVDVSLIVNVAFRNAAPDPDPNPVCPVATTDVDCSGATDIVDVSRMVNVAFRDGTTAANFCDPCNPTRAVAFTHLGASK